MLLILKLETVMTLDFMLGFASPTAKVVKMSPQGLRGWLYFGMAKKVVANDGYIFMACGRLIGITLGVTVCIECATPNAATGPSTPVQSVPQSPRPQLSAEQLASLRAMAAAQLAQQQAQATPSAPPSSAPTPTTASKGQ